MDSIVETAQELMSTLDNDLTRTATKNTATLTLFRVTFTDNWGRYCGLWII